MTEKTCIKCNEIRPVSAFYKDASRRDGFRETCRDCTSKARGTFDKQQERRKLEAQGLKRCPHCQEIKSVDQFRKQKTRNGNVRLTAWCSTCSNESTARFHEKKKDDPVYAEKLRERNKRRYHEVIKVDPVEIEKKRERMREYASRPEVKERAAERSSEWVANNPERARENQKRWRYENLEKVREHGRTYHARHHEQRLESNRERLRERRWRMQIQGDGLLTALHVGLIRAFWDDHCAYCGIAMTPKGVGARTTGLDHVLPLSEGGGHGPNNVVMSCAPCNYRKNRSILPDALLDNISEQLDAFVQVLPGEAAFNQGTIPIAIRRICMAVEDQIRGLGISVGVNWPR